MRNLIWKSKVWGGKLQRIFLRYIFKFDNWHIFTLAEKKYAKDIIGYCNARSVRNSFVEIGCGLGDIVRHVRYYEREAYDMDEKVLKAARFLNTLTGGKRIRFSAFTFPGTPLHGKFDVVVLVNWIHHIEPSVLKSSISDYFNNALNKTGVIIIDTVQDPEYKFNHDILYLTDGINAGINKLGDYERQRQIWLIEK
ncbi:MAG TPA: class I SAM-dependent methyltransferase [Puia sp.]|jgi:SAM-dependent methyltransferase|nr:class I SAM-dependent methyltransferase [Puia sp.]